MNRVGHLGAGLAAVAAGAAFVLLEIWSSPPAEGEDLTAYGRGVVVLAGPWALAAWLLWRAWWWRTGARLSTMDAPARLLALAVALLPADRQHWGAAMTAELDHVWERRARWRFAAGCARAAVFPPPGRRVPVLVVAALAALAVVATAQAVGHALPAMRVFAVAFVGLAGVLATVGAARSWRPSRPAPGPAVAVTGLAGVAACVAVTGYSLGTDVAATLRPPLAVTLAVGLAGCLWLTLAPPRALTTSRLARRAGLAAGLAATAALELSVRLDNGEGVMAAMLFVPVGAYLVASVLAAATGRSFWAGIQATVWSAVVTTLLTFAVWVVEATHWYDANHTYLLDGDGGPRAANLHDAIVWIVVAVPLWTLPFGIIGAALGGIGTIGTRDPVARATRG